MTISIIIPTYNEADAISDIISYLKNHTSRQTQIIVVDGQSEDNTMLKAREAGACCLSSSKGRARQMNKGARKASGDVLYFVHADAFPPVDFIAAIENAVNEGYEAGCFRFKFDSKRTLLKINSYCTRFDRIMCRGGDQTLFITREQFNKMGGYRDDYIIMEDYELIERIQKNFPFKIIPKNVTVSARKYEQNSYLKVQMANLIIFMMYFLGCSQEKMFATYKNMLTFTTY